VHNGPRLSRRVMARQVESQKRGASAELTGVNATLSALVALATVLLRSGLCDRLALGSAAVCDAFSTCGFQLGCGVFGCSGVWPVNGNALTSIQRADPNTNLRLKRQQVQVASAAVACGALHDDLGGSAVCALGSGWSAASPLRHVEMAHPSNSSLPTIRSGPACCALTRMWRGCAQAYIATHWRSSHWSGRCQPGHGLMRVRATRGAGSLAGKLRRAPTDVLALCGFNVSFRSPAPPSHAVLYTTTSAVARFAL
jgi:hypothetical protein